MKKIDLGQAISIVANVGVILGIAFLAVEVSQNTDALTAQARYNHLQGRQYSRVAAMENREFASTLARLATNEELSPEDEIQIASYFQYAFLGWQWEYGEYLAGRLPREDLPTNGWKLAMQESGSGGPTSGMLEESIRTDCKWPKTDLCPTEPNVRNVTRKRTFTHRENSARFVNR